MAFTDCGVTWYGSTGHVEPACGSCFRPRSEHLRSLRDEQRDVGTEAFADERGLCPDEAAGEIVKLIQERRWITSLRWLVPQDERR